MLRAEACVAALLQGLVLTLLVAEGKEALLLLLQGLVSTLLVAEGKEALLLLLGPGFDAARC